MIHNKREAAMGEVLILRYLAGPSLDELVAVRGRLHCAEIATIVIGLCRALQALTIAGVVHGRLTAQRIRFDGHGAPVITGFGRATLTTSAAAASRKDTIDFAVIVEQLVKKSIDPWPENARVMINRLVRRARRGEGGINVLARWESVLFHALKPGPVDIDLDSLRNRGHLRSRPGRSQLTAEGIRSLVCRAVAPLRASARSSLLRRAMELSTRTRAIILASAVTTSVVCVILGATWGSSPSTKTVPHEPTTASEPIAINAEVGHEVEPSTHINDSDDIAMAAIHGDDPVTAITVLLSQRSVCIRQSEPGCVDLIDEPESVQWTDDRRLILDSANSRPTDYQRSENHSRSSALDKLNVSRDDPLKGAAPRLVNFLGAAAVLALDHPGVTNPTSILMIKGAAGWRIREIIASSG